MKKWCSMKSAGISTFITGVIFMFSRGDRLLDYMWISFIFSILSMIIILNLKRESSRLKSVLFYTNLFYTVAFGLLYVFLWCALYAGPFPEWQ